MAGKPDRTIEALLKEKREFEPPPRLSALASASTPAGTGKRTGTSSPSGPGSPDLDGFEPWKNGLDWKPPRAGWA